MATITANPTDTQRQTPQPLTRLRTALTQAKTRTATAAIAARNRNWSPTLTSAGLTSAVTSAWHTFGMGAGMLALAGAFFAFDWSRD